MLALHRVRSLLIRERTALMNQMRGLLAEYGIVVAQGATPLRRALALIMKDRENGTSELLRELLAEMSERLRCVRGAFETVRPADRGNCPRRRARRSSDGGGRGVGPLTATALIAAGRQRAAVPQRARVECMAGAGATPVLKRRAQRYYSGSVSVATAICVRCLSTGRGRRCGSPRANAIHAAAGSEQVGERRGANIAAVALANKNARVLWALLARNEDYRVPAAA